MSPFRLLLRSGISEVVWLMRCRARLLTRSVTVEARLTWPRASRLAVNWHLPRTMGRCKEKPAGGRRGCPTSVFLVWPFTHSSAQSSFTIKDIFCASHHGSHLSLSSHVVCTCVMTGTETGVYQVKGISVSPREGYLPQAKFVFSMASLSWELILAREDYLICNTLSPTLN